MNLARELGMDWGEVTATHTNLLAIAEVAHAQHIPIHIERITQQRERSMGADWEFWLETKSGAVMGYSVQAKKVYARKSGYAYPHLGHRGERSLEKQYDTLIRHAAAVGALPFHVFYNGWSLPNRFLSFRDSRAPELFGCAAVSSYDVRAIHRGTKRLKGNVEHYIAASIPWSDLFRVGSGGSGGAGGSTPSNPGSSPTSPQHRSAKLTRSDLQRLLERHSSHLAERPILGTSLPGYVLKARQLPPDKLPDAPELPEFVVVASAA